MDRKAIAKALERAGLRPGLTVRTGSVTPDTYNLEKNEVRFVASTELPATVFDWDRYEFVQEVLRADGMVVPESGQVPLLDTHSRNTVDDVLGSVTDFQQCDVAGYPGRDCLSRFGSDERAKRAENKVAERHITDVSVGYEVLESYWIPEGEKQVIGDREYEGPVKVSTRWAIKELSLVPIGADRLAKVRAMVMAPDESIQRGEGMKKCPDCGKELEDGGCTCGYRADKSAGDNQRGQESTPAAPAPAVDVEKERAKAVTAERQRAKGIRDAVSVAGLDSERAEEMIDSGMSMDAARAEIFKGMKERNKAIGAGSGISVETDSRDKFRAAAGDGLALRAGIKIQKPAAGAREFRGRSMVEIVRECLEAAGVNTRGMSRRQVVGRALGGPSSSDFPLLMSQLAGKRLLAAYDEMPSTWRPFVDVVDAIDFKEIHGIKLSEAPDLMPLNEKGEYVTAKFSEKQERYRVSTKGRIINLTRVMIINDDLRAFVRIPKLLGNASVRMESDMVYSLLTGNPVMSDGLTLFHVDHGNVGTEADMDSDSLTKGRVAMRKQKGMGGSRLDIRPEFLLTPVVKETDSEVILRSTAMPSDNKSSGVHNPWANRLNPIAEPRLDDDDPNAWYMLASPGQAPVIEVAYLEGEEKPYIEEEIEFKSDSLGIKVRHDFGCGVTDHVGIFRNKP